MAKGEKNKQSDITLINNSHTDCSSLRLGLVIEGRGVGDFGIT